MERDPARPLSAEVRAVGGGFVGGTRITKRRASERLVVDLQGWTREVGTHVEVSLHASGAVDVTVHRNFDDGSGWGEMHRYRLSADEGSRPTPREEGPGLILPD